MKTSFEILKSFHTEIKGIFNDSIGFKSISYYFWLMLFLKRYSDRFYEEVEAILSKDKIPKTAAEFLCFHTKIALPEEARWGFISNGNKDIGEKIKNALKLIEDYNSEFGKILSSTIPIWPQDNVMSDIIESFNRLNLENAALDKPSVIVDFYNYLKENDDESIKDENFEKAIKRII